VAQQAARLAQQGFRPDLIIGHPGWGELLAIKDVFPNVPVLHQLEFVYQLSGADVGFDPEFTDPPDPTPAWRAATRLRLRRAPQLLALHDLDHAWAPTQWQASTAPEVFADRITVIHEGIDTQAARPNPMAEIRLQAAGLSFRPGDELVSFVARNLEPYRGFHVFMRMLPLLQARRPHCHVVIVGADGVSYGSPPPDGRSWRQTLLQELDGQLDLSRIHFVGRVPHSVLHNLFQVSACHVYLTYPFVLSWSLLEAMSCGAVVVASATAPVQEVIADGENGFLVDFFDSAALAARVEAVLEAPGEHRALAREARRTVQQRYDLESMCLPRQLQLVEQLLGAS
jgi:glycosyltransferase involved in cell wall biosynthesis